MRYSKPLVIVLILVSIIGCKSRNEDKNALLSTNWESEIKLDGTNKWTANKETTIGINKMIAILENIDTSAEIDYALLGTDLRSEINHIMQKCSMKGPSHDNLHVFLIPLIEEVDAFKDSKNSKEDRELVARVFYHLKAYEDYFE